MTATTLENRYAQWQNITWYGFRNTHITLRPNAVSPVPVMTDNYDMHMRYNEEYYFRTVLQSKPKYLTKEEHLDWVNQLHDKIKSKANRKLSPSSVVNIRRYPIRTTGAKPLELTIKFAQSSILANTHGLHL